MFIKKNRDETASSRQGIIGIGFVVLATVMFSFLDALTKTLLTHYPITFIVMVRCWVFLPAGLLLAAMTQGGLRANIRSRCLLLQCLRCLAAICQWMVTGLAVGYLGLAEATSLYEAYPLFGTILAALLLGESVGWRRCLALAAGFSGILIMLRPGAGIMSQGAVYALGGGLCFAVYVILTRLVGRYDKPETSFFYIGAVGCVAMTAGFPFFYVSMASGDAWLLAVLCAVAIGAHFCMIKALSLAPVTLIQPFSYLQLVWSVIVGLIVFGNMPDVLTLVGAAIIVASGLYVFFREQLSKPRIEIKEHDRP